MCKPDMGLITTVTKIIGSVTVVIVQGVIAIVVVILVICVIVIFSVHCRPQNYALVTPDNDNVIKCIMFQ